ncbi:hypothetical protein SAMN04488062_11575 [Flavobacterium omnivorum]|uniref:Pyridine nucleotide-disulphide oxidoreductase n=1 Tax=Flavobacterium omnivorum TaxID=178355 RepID=A0A1G8FKQ0_9FLAO|nr:hypothetical protein [Flavobacterium omnivorum]SDH82730.1 hypothetical protein SAMN04488062_11575 [Flavobacterium omnivorum]
MSNHFQILIIGGGNAGISVASQLLYKRSNLTIGILPMLPAVKLEWQSENKHPL